MVRAPVLIIVLTVLVLVTGSTKEDICSLDPDNGGCSSYTEKFFFNRFTGQCHEFVFGGCLGNKNQFDSRDECESFCEGMAFDKKPDCEKLPEKGPCDGLLLRYYFDAEGRSCETFWYGGCRGNANNFRNTEDCMDTCFQLT